MILKDSTTSDLPETFLPAGEKFIKTFLPSEAQIAKICVKEDQLTKRWFGFIIHFHQDSRKIVEIGDCEDYPNVLTR